MFSLENFGPAILAPKGSLTLYESVLNESFVDIQFWLEVQFMDVNSIYMNENTPLHAAATLDDMNYSLVLMEYGANPTAINVLGDTPLLIALTHRRIKTADYLIRCGSPINNRNKRGLTPLIIATKKKYYDIVELLLHKGADPNLSEFTGSSLHFAASYGYLDIVKLLIENNADINIKDQCLGRTPLCRAVIGGHYEVCRYLLKAGAILEEEDINRMRALHLAAIKGFPQITTLLLNYDADINSKDGFGDTPAHKAGQFRKREIFSILIQKGAKHRMQNHVGRIPNFYDIPMQGLTPFLPEVI